jgi:hypothetical protein
MYKKIKNSYKSLEKARLCKKILLSMTGSEIQEEKFSIVDKKLKNLI